MQNEDLKASMNNSFLCLFLSSLTDMTLPSGNVDESLKLADTDSRFLDQIFPILTGKANIHPSYQSR